MYKFLLAFGLALYYFIGLRLLVPALVSSHTDAGLIALPVYVVLSVYITYITIKTWRKI